MKRFHIVVNAAKDPGLTVTKKITGFLQEQGLYCDYETINRNDPYNKALNKNAFLAECLLVLGGDGTFIQVAGKIAGTDIPMLGINLGNVGYLAETEREDILEALNSLIDDNYDIEDRMMLSGKYTSEGERKIQYALNDIVISRCESLRTIKYEIYVNDRLLNSYNADGIIISTPTGSTGYNLSAGGPIVEPVAELLLLNPICPHTLNTRAVILSARDEIRIRVIKGKYKKEFEAAASFDGGNEIFLRASEDVLIKKADVRTRIIKLRKESFLNILSRKMRLVSYNE
ncbi:MAG: NAD(+)/NADH kinase [Lachnospiraceae bacterium]|nr:NAD(+)/NADH kinase [Lachnospiraceae bacterium]